MNNEQTPPTLTGAMPEGGAPPRAFRCGELCPRCGLGVLDYNGLLDLECPVCGYSEGPGGGCT